MKNGYIKQAWLVLTLALCFGGALAGVQLMLGERIASNVEADAESQIPDLVFGPERAAEMAGKFAAVAETITAAVNGRDVPYKVYRVTGKDSAQLLGWVVKASGQGFADTVDLLIGLDAGAGRITGLYVLGQKETPGLGNKIIDAPWRAQFTGLQTDRKIGVVKAAPVPNSNDVQAVTGATISSQSVARIVNEAVEALQPVLTSEAN